MRYTYEKKRASGRRESWAKLVQNVDRDVRGAKAFLGDYLRDGAQIELAEGCIVLEVCPEGSVKNGHQQAYLYRVDGDALVSYGDADGWNWYSEFLDLRDAVERALVGKVCAKCGSLISDPQLAGAERCDACADDQPGPSPSAGLEAICERHDLSDVDLGRLATRYIGECCDLDAFAAFVRRAGKGCNQ